MDLERNDDDALTEGQTLQALREELARLQARVATLEEQARTHASRRICALMTEITTLEKDILDRPVTTSDLKKAGMKAMGMDRT